MPACPPARSRSKFSRSRMHWGLIKYRWSTPTIWQEDGDANEQARYAVHVVQLLLYAPRLAGEASSPSACAGTTSHPAGHDAPGGDTRPATIPSWVRIVELVILIPPRRRWRELDGAEPPPLASAVGSARVPAVRLTQTCPQRAPIPLPTSQLLSPATYPVG